MDLEADRAGPGGRGGPDPGSPRVARLASILVVVLILSVFALQQLGSSTAARAKAPTGEAVPKAQAPIEKPDAQVELSVKMYVKFRASGMPLSAGDVDRMLAREGSDPAALIRRAIVAAELGRPASEAPGEAEPRALGLLDEAERTTELDPRLAADVADLRALYSAPSTGLSAESRERLEKQHGWFATLASVYVLDADARERQAVVGGGMALALLLLGFFGLVGLLFVVGLVLLFMELQKRARGRRWDRFVPPSPGGSMAIEIVAVFVAGFLLLKAATVGLATFVHGDSLIWIALGLQWLLLGAVLWPVLRGVPAREAMRRLGLHRGEGVWRELGAGLVGYITSFPIILGVAFATVVLVYLKNTIEQLMGKPESGPPDNPIIDMVAGGSSPWLLAMFFLLASVWAPLAEEMVFRGALFRFLRERWPLWAAALVSALGFGVMHGYPLLMLGPVISIGFCFAFMRERRDSLIGMMFAHSLHNATVLAFLLTLLSLVG